MSRININLRFKLLIILLFVLSGTKINAHGDLHKRILNVTEEIKKYPDSANLYFKRGILYYQHKNYPNSLNDFKSSKGLGFESIEQDFYLAKINYHLENYHRAKKLIRKILREESANTDALKLLADIYFRKGDYKKSAMLYDELIQKSEVTFPEHYLYASKSWYATKTDIGYGRAQSILIEGIEKLGDIIVLYNQLISNYIDLKEFDSAVKFQEKVIEISNRKERAFLKLANIQIRQQDYKEALLSISKAEESYRELPHRLRNTEFMKKFYAELQSKKLSLKK